MQKTISVTWPMMVEKLGINVSQPAVASSATPAKLTAAPSPIQALMLRSCGDGERTDHLTTLAGTLITSGFGLDECIDACRLWNKGNRPPLEGDKIVKTCTSIGLADQKNHPERYPNLLRHAPLFELQDGRIDRYLSTPPPLRRWLLKDLIVLGKVGAVVAPGGSSKSQWLLQLGVSVATGITLAGHWEVGEAGGVLVLFAEDDADEIHRRLHRVHAHLQRVGYGKELAALKDRLFMYSTIGIDTLLTKKQADGEVSSTIIIERIAALAEQIPDLRLIVIDPASRFRGGEENSNEDATRFVEALEKLAKQTGASIMIAHHTNKGSYGNTDAGQGASRGASALTDGLRWQMNLGRPSDAQASALGISKEALNGVVAATVTKTNYSAFPPPVLLERGPDGYLSVISAGQAQKNVELQAILSVLQAIHDYGKPISARALEVEYAGAKASMKMSKDKLRAAIKLGLDRGFIDGGARKPLRMTELGGDMLRCMQPPPADVPMGVKKPAR